MEDLEICFVFVVDYDVVVEFFCVIYEDKVDEDYDYIFNRFYGWFLECKWVVFVVEMDEKIVGLWSYVVVNGD